MSLLILDIHVDLVHFDRCERNCKEYRKINGVFMQYVQYLAMNNNKS